MSNKNNCVIELSRNELNIVQNYIFISEADSFKLNLI